MKNNKFLYEKPIVEMIRLTAEDVLTTSGQEPAELEEIED